MRLEHRGWARCEEGMLLGQEESPQGECGRSSPEAGPGDSGDGLVGQQGLVEREWQDTGFAAMPRVAVEGEGDEHSPWPWLR